MEPHLAVDEKNSLLEVRPQRAKQTLPVRIAARIISYLFHPLFIPVYLCWLIVKTQSLLIWLIHRMGKNDIRCKIWSDLYLLSLGVCFTYESVEIYQLDTIKNAERQDHPLRSLHDLLLVDVVRVA